MEQESRSVLPSFQQISYSMQEGNQRSHMCDHKCKSIVDFRKSSVSPLDNRLGTLKNCFNASLTFFYKITNQKLCVSSLFFIKNLRVLHLLKTFQNIFIINEILQRDKVIILHSLYYNNMFKTMLSYLRYCIYV